jgi:hypothetical protein
MLPKTKFCSQLATELNLLCASTSTNQLSFGSRHRHNWRHENASGEDIIMHENKVATSILARILVISPGCISECINLKQFKTLFQRFGSAPRQFQVFDSSEVSQNLLEHFILSFGSFGHNECIYLPHS